MSQPTDDPVAALDTAAWALAAVIGTLSDASDAPLSDVLAADPARTEVLRAAGLVSKDGDVFTPHPALAHADGPTAMSAAQARLSSLRQALAAAQGSADGSDRGWAQQEDAVLLHQGRASAMTGRALAGKVVPALPGLAEALAAEGGRVLDVGTGVAALALVLAQAFPRAHLVGVDILERVLELARGELAAADAEVADRISLRRLDVAEISEPAAYDLVWLPAPFLSEAALTAAVPQLADALKPGGWIVAGTNPAVPEPLRQAVAGWNAVRNGGNSWDTDRVAHALAACGLGGETRFPTVPGGPVLVAARRGTG
ncbi:hypothetical protein GCM10010129_67450 [Streptomyces fumigatiscleroticus]|nr:hypothetical protein GCM10010129_67450 [Streptomyces fumigatiscleroticus]